MSKKPYKSVRVFENPYLEMLTHVHPIVPLVFWSPVISFLYWRAVHTHELAPLSILGITISALAFWTLAEYILHRWIFHFDAKTDFGKRIHFLIHGLHHDDPNDPTRLVMPPAGAVIIAAVLYSIFRIFLGPIWVDPFFAGFLIGYLCYDYIHYWIHHFTPTTNFGKMIKQHHMVHHFVAHEAKWGVSSPFWDHVFGTVKEKKRS